MLRWPFRWTRRELRAAVARLVSLSLIRGWCLTKMTGFPIPESRSKSRSLECHGSRTNLQSHRTERAFRNRKRNEAGREWHERTTAKWSAVSGMLVECVTG